MQIIEDSKDSSWIFRTFKFQGIKFQQLWFKITTHISNTRAAKCPKFEHSQLRARKLQTPKLQIPDTQIPKTSSVHSLISDTEIPKLQLYYLKLYYLLPSLIRQSFQIFIFNPRIYCQTKNLWNFCQKTIKSSFFFYEFIKNYNLPQIYFLSNNLKNFKLFHTIYNLKYSLTLSNFLPNRFRFRFSFLKSVKDQNLPQRNLILPSTLKPGNREKKIFDLYSKFTKN